MASVPENSSPPKRVGVRTAKKTPPSKAVASFGVTTSAPRKRTTITVPKLRQSSPRAVSAKVPPPTHVVTTEPRKFSVTKLASPGDRGGVLRSTRVVKARAHAKSQKSPPAVEVDMLESVSPLAGAQKTSTKTDDEIVAVPRAFSPRVHAKVSALKSWYQHELPRLTGRCARVTGLFFVGVGGLGLSAVLATVYPNWLSLQQALSCTVVFCDERVEGTQLAASVGSIEPSLAAISTPLPSPVVTYLTPLPAELTASTSLIVRAEYAAHISVYLESLTRGAAPQLLLPDREAAGSDHSFTLDPAVLLPDEYQVRVSITMSPSESEYRFSGPRFVIPERDDTPRGEVLGMSSPAVIVADAEAGESFAEPATSSRSTANPDESTDETEESERVESAALMARVRNSELSVVFTSAVADSVQIYAQRLSARTPLHLGFARRAAGDTWLLTVPETMLPRGDYAIVARSLVAGSYVESERFMVTIDHELALETQIASSTFVQETQAALIRLDNTEAREIARDAYADLVLVLDRGVTTALLERAPLGSAPAATATSQSPIPSLPSGPYESAFDELIREKLLAESATLNRVLLRYAAAFQVGDEVLMQLAEAAISQEIRRLVGVIVTSEVPLTASDAENYLTQVTAGLLVAVRNYEDELRTESNQASARDTDRDGLSDYDEFTWFGTNPESYDTDRDGISDGVEIMNIEDPSNPRSDRIFTHESPRTLSASPRTALSIHSVTPVYEADDHRGVPPVQLRVRGSGVPLSYVHLYVFSTPTITVVPVAADGTFDVVFDAALTAGEHELYATYVDSTGTLLEVSAPVGLTLAEGVLRLSETNESTSSVRPTSQLVTPSQLYQMVSALVLVAFGLALLVLGHAVSRRRVSPEYKSLAETSAISVP